MAIYKDTIKRRMVGHKPIQPVKFGYLVQSNYYHTSCHLLLGIGPLSVRVEPDKQKKERLQTQDRF